MFNLNVYSTETHFSDAPIEFTTPIPATKSVQWDTKRPITILDEDRPDSRYGSHGSIDTIMRKQWIENRTETLTKTTSPVNPGLYENALEITCSRVLANSVRGSNHSLLDSSREPPSYTLMDTQPDTTQKREAERLYAAKIDHQRSSSTQGRKDIVGRIYINREGNNNRTEYRIVKTSHNFLRGGIYSDYIRI